MKSRKVAPSDDTLHKEGRWFLADDFLLQPNFNNVHVIADVSWPTNISKVRHLRSRKSQNKTLGHRPGELTRKEAWARTRRIRREIKAMMDANTASYRGQPKWSLAGITVNSAVEASELLDEFMDFVDHTTSYFAWIGGFSIATGLSIEELKKHGWKHITYDLMKDLCDEGMNTLVPKVARADLVGTSHQFVDLIRQAENRVPQAVARLDFLFPDREDLANACYLYLSEKIPRERLDAIPTVSQLAGTWATAAVRNPESEEANAARNLLRLLVSKGSSLRSSLDKGRPKLQVHEMAIHTLYIMSSCLFIQIQQVREFLDTAFADCDKYQCRLVKIYPWLKDVAGRDILSFIEGPVSKGAMEITGHLLKISMGKVQQVLYKH